MNYTEIALIGLILAVDATIYAFSYGLLLRRNRARAAFSLALCTGLFQAVMPLLGYYSGQALRHLVSTWAPWLVLAIFCTLGTSIIYKTWLGSHHETDQASETTLGFAALILVGLATSIDALAVGVCMALGNIGGPQLQLSLAIAIIGGITFTCTLLSFHAARLLHHLPGRWLETLAGLLLIALGVQNIM